MTEPVVPPDASAFVDRLNAAKNDAARLGLWKTMHALDEATRTVGWELADQILKARKGK